MKKIYLLLCVLSINIGLAQTSASKTNNTLTECACNLAPWTFGSNTSVSNSFTMTGHSRHLYAGDFGFNIPANAIIDGIEVSFTYTINTSATPANTLKDTICMLQKGGISQGDNKCSLTGFYNNPSGLISLGAYNDLWGNTWTPNDINAINFGFDYQLFTNVLNSQVGIIQGFQINVFYTNTSGIKESQSSSSSLYVHGKTLFFRTEFDANSKIEVFDALGKKVYETKPEAGQKNLELSHLEKGMYLYRMNSVKGEVSRKIYLD